MSRRATDPVAVSQLRRIRKLHEAQLRKIRRLHETFRTSVITPEQKADQAFWLAVGEILAQTDDGV